MLVSKTSTDTCDQGFKYRLWLRKVKVFTISVGIGVATMIAVVAV